jgi:glucosamine-6-phosphate deaminase
MSDPFPRRFLCERLAVEVHRDRAALGLAAARAVAAHLRDLIATQGGARVIFACAPSQDEFLAALTDPARCGVEIAWERVTAFHMDDYVGLPGTHSQSFRHYLKTHLLDRVPVGKFLPLRAETADLDAVCADYAARLDERPIDLICLGIGENGHIAFNDPPVADFDDPVLVKRVALDDACRRQQVNDGCFSTFADVPTHALTLTVPVFRHARRLSVHVPGPRKAAAVRATLHDPLSPACPATILRTHPQATLHLDTDSAGVLDAIAGSTTPA